jgi:tryptophan 2,3-dioxygenase
MASNSTSRKASPLPDERAAPSTYVTYLRIDELLDLQKPVAERLHADELTFQIVHQTFELWWKATVEFFARASERLAADDPAGALPLLRRAVSAQEVNLRALRQLELVAPVDFLTIRQGLGDGSGADSPGFRAILRAAPSLWDAYSAALARADVTLLKLYQDPPAHLALYECAEALVDFDEIFHLFRAMHLKLAQRNLGLRAIGTGGTPMGMLERTLRDVLFLPLWETRDELLALAGDSPTDATGHSA